jgi:3'(2'), 5'-bisphosphate nucleotidase
MSLARRLLAAAALAGRVLLKLRKQSCDVRDKADGSPVSTADLESNRVLASTLAVLGPEWAVVSEESDDNPAADTAGGPLVLVDPLDGTREFLAGRPDFAVCIGLVRGGYPVAGCVLAPALRQAWTADTTATAWRLDDALDPLEGRRLEIAEPAGQGGFAAVISLSHGDSETRALAAAAGATRFELRGSALKFVAVAGGEAALYPRLGRTMPWDTSAGQAIVEAAGGVVLAADGRRMAVGERELRDGNPPFVAAAGAGLAARALAHWPR